MGEVRAAIVGYGLAGRVFHGRLLAGTPGARVTAIVTGNAGRRAEAAADFPAATVHAEVGPAIDAADLVVVATPNGSHAPVAAAAIGAGRAVVVDKPLALTAAAAADLVAQAAAAGVPLTVFQNRRWDADQLTLRRLLDAGELGEVRRYESRFERWRPEITPGKWRESLPEDAGGGLLLDLGTHLVDQAVQLFGPVDRVYAEADGRRGGPVDDAFLALTHATGVRSALWVSSVAAVPGPRLRVLGSTGGYLVEHLDGQEAALRAGRVPGTGELWGVVPPGRGGVLCRGAETRPVAPERGRWDGFYPAVLAAVRGEAPVPVDPRDAVSVLAVLAAARSSAETGTVVDLG